LAEHLVDKYAKLQLKITSSGKKYFIFNT